VNRGIIAGIATGGAGILGLTLFLLWGARRKPVVTGEQTLIGHTVEVLEPIETEGWGWVAGERWRLRTRVPLRAGERPRIVSMDGLTLIVEPAEKGD
jgi:membrane-bound serine protease (ClpP class)